MWKKVALGLLLFGIIAAVVVYVTVWNKPHRDLLDEPTAFAGTTEGFAAAFFASPQSMHDSLFDKVVSLEGNLHAADRSGDSTIQLVFLSPEAEILCGFSGQPGFDVGNPQLGKKMNIRGIYTGYTEGLPGFEDMMPTLTLNRCILEQ